MKNILIVAALTIAAVPLRADNWPQWRGPSLNGVSAETSLPVRWSKIQNIAWKLAMPAWSGSTPIVWDDWIFLNVAGGPDLYLWSIDRNRGQMRWKQRLAGGTYFYAINDRGIMWCLDAKTGGTIYGPQRLRSATYSGSPVLANGKIFITDEDGATSVVQVGLKFAVLAVNDFGEYTLSSPAISDGQIIIRTDAFSYAIGQRRPARR